MGLEAIITPIVSSAAKSIVNFDLAVDPLIAQLQKSCPSKPELDKILAKKNQMSQALSQVQKGLTTLSDTSSTLDTILTGADIAVKVIKALPVPTSVPPGVGIPLNVINGFTSTLIKLADLIKTGKVTVGQIAPATKVMVDSIAAIQDKLSQLDGLLAKCLVEQTAGMTDEEKEAYFTSLGIDLKSSSTTGDGTKPGESLEDRLSPNSTNPYVYKGYTIILDTNSGNKFSFPERRAIGTNAEGEKIVGPWSYSASTQVLLDGVKFEIDKLDRLALKAADEAAADEAARLEAQRRAEEARQKALAAQEQRRKEAYNLGKKAGTGNKPQSQNPYAPTNKNQYDAWNDGWKEGAMISISAPPSAALLGALIPPSNTTNTGGTTTTTTTNEDYIPFGFAGDANGETRTYSNNQVFEVYVWNAAQDRWIKQ